MAPFLSVIFKPVVVAVAVRVVVAAVVAVQVVVAAAKAGKAAAVPSSRVFSLLVELVAKVAKAEAAVAVGSVPALWGAGPGLRAVPVAAPAEEPVVRLAAAA